MEEFINLRQGGVSVQEYSLKFTKLYKYAPSLMSNPRDEMSKFITGVSNDLVERWHFDMLHDNMDMYRLMVPSQQVKRLYSRGRIKSLRG